jgi:phosphopantothenoylcysteine decarboxylase/phosphopantothenate--cysteine ligase
MRCVVTAGPTYEPLDEVRRLTNFSTGRLGSEWVNFLAAHGHEVILLVGQLSTWRGERHAARVETFTTTADLSGRLRALAAENVDAVFHAAAVSDFSFGQVWRRSASGQLMEVKCGKLSTREGALLAELVPTQKIIAQLRDWYPNARLVGWKYEVDGDRATTVATARSQLAECRTDACVANGPAYGEGFGLVRATDEPQHCADMAALFRALETFVGSQSTRHA